MVLHIPQRHVADAVKELHQFFISADDRGPQLVAVHVKIVKKTGKIAFRLAALSGFLNMPEDGFQGFIQVFVARRPGPDIAKQLAWQHKKALFFYQPFFGLSRLGVRHAGIVKIGVSRRMLAAIDIAAQFFGNISVKHGAKHIVLEIPAVYRAAQLVRNGPDGAVKLVTFLFFLGINHFLSSVF